MGSISVSEIQAALPPETRLVAGASGLRREVSWPAMLRTRPPAFQSLKGGEFLLISTEAMRLLDPQLTLARLLQSVARVEVAAAAVAGEVTDEAAKLAESLALPLYLVPSGTSLVDLEQQFVHEIVDWQTDLQRRSQEIYRHLTELAIEGRGLPAIAAGLARATGRRVAHEDRSLILAVYGQPPADITTGKQLPASVTEDELTAAFREGQPALARWLRNRKLSASEPPTAEFPMPSIGFSRLVAPVVLREGVVSYLSLLDEGRGFREIDRLAIVRAAAACAIEMLRESAALEAEDRVGATFLDDLLTGVTVSPEAVRRLAPRLGFDLTLPHLVLVFQRSSPDAEISRARRPAEDSSTPSALQAAIEQEASRRRVRVISRGWEERAAVLYPITQPDQSRTEIPAIASAVGSRLGTLVSVGVGQLAASPDAIPNAYREALGALTLGTRLFGPGRVTYYADLGLYRLLLAMNGTAELRSFYQETLGKLFEHEKRGDGELIRTLEAYFAGRSSPTEAAERLHVHRNTLLYRLRRIQAVTGLDLDDPETRLALNLALHVGHVLGK